MEVDPNESDSDQLSKINVTVNEDIHGQVNAYGSPIRANAIIQSTGLRCESAIVTTSALLSTSQKINQVVRISLNQLCVFCKCFSLQGTIFCLIYVFTIRVKYELLPVCRFAVVRIPALSQKKSARYEGCPCLNDNLKCFCD